MKTPHPLALASLLALLHPASAEPLSPAARILGAALSGEGPFALARDLADTVGARLAGSVGAERSVAWAVTEMKRAGLSNVHTEKVRVPRWERGPRAEEGGELLVPLRRPLSLVALGGSVGGAVAGAVVEASSFEELRRLGRSAVAGKIVLWHVVMKRGWDGMSNYGEVAPFRTWGAVEAARLGAAASLVRSLGVASYRLPHTGAMRYDQQVPRIPAAALSAEDADLIHRLLQAGPVRLRLRLPCRELPDADGYNVVGEVPGARTPEEIVLLGAHLDSWDLGDGAIDDGAGVAIVLGAARALVGAGVRPRRTVRVVLFANEENGLRGGHGYAAAHERELPRHVAALEADSGGGRPSGFLTPSRAGADLLRDIAAPLRALGIADASVGSAGGADLSPLEGQVPFFQLQQDTSRYFEWHHTAADTLDKLDPLDLDLCAAAVAVAAHGLADSERTLPRMGDPKLH